MAVPGSGELSLLKIAREKVYDDYNSASSVTGPISLKDVSTSGNANGSGVSFDVTNIESPSFPDAVAGYGIEEFYAYDHDFIPIPCSKAMDVLFLIDYTGSMGNDINTMKTNVAAISNKVISRSGGDYRLAAVLYDQGTPSYVSGSSFYTGLPAAQKYAANGEYITAIVPFANANKSDFDTKIGYLNTTNSATGMALGDGDGAPEPLEIGLERILNNNIAGAFRSGVKKMIIIITDNAPDGDGDDTFNGSEETAKMGTLTSTAVANNISISVLGTISNTTSSDGTTTAHSIYGYYASNTGGNADFAADPSDIMADIDSVCNGIEANFASVITNNPTNITSSGFRMHGDITSQGGSSLTGRGFVRATSGINLFIGASGVTNDAFATIATGTFQKTLSGLSSSTTYYYKAYATNSTGTTYGAIKSATTSAGNVIIAVDDGIGLSTSYVEVTINSVVYDAVAGEYNEYELSITPGTTISVTVNAGSGTTDQIYLQADDYYDSTSYGNDSGTTASLSFNYTIPSSNAGLYVSIVDL